MKITDITVHLVKERRTFLFVIVETDKGITGVGEAGITGRELAVAGAIEHFKPLLIGLDPFQTEHIWQLLFRGGFFPAQRILTAAISAIDIALWDIKGKALGVPLYELLGGKVRNKVACYCHNTGSTISELVDSCKRAVDEGWRFVRFGIAEYPITSFEPMQAVNRSIREFEAVRKAVGEQIEICFDVHTRLDLRDSIRLCREVEQFRPFFIEDPLRSENPDSYKTIRARTFVPLAAGEQYNSKWEFRQLIEEEWIDFARIDLCICGGLTEAKKIAGWCETHYIALAVHNPIGPVATMANLHLNLTVPNFGVQELPRAPGDSLADAVKGQPRFEDGCLLPPEKPGLGLEIDVAALKKYTFEMTELPHYTREDGSFTNW
jgi:L-alanine-DL-glutamate epimerase-like enolase superfamily enzyme